MNKKPKLQENALTSTASLSSISSPSPPSTPHLSPYKNPSHFNQLANLGMKIRSSVYKGYYTTPTSSPNQDISKQQELYNSIHPPITPSIFSTATQTLNHSRSLLEFTDNNDVFSSPLPLAPNNLKRKGNDDKEVNDDDTDEMSTDSTNCRQIKAMKKAPRSIAPLSSPPSPPPNNLISSPTYNKLSHFNIASSPDTHSAHNQLTDNTTDTAEPWKHINYSLYADIDVDESMF